MKDEFSLEQVELMLRKVARDQLPLESQALVRGNSGWFFRFPLGLRLVAKGTFPYSDVSVPASSTDVEVIESKETANIQRTDLVFVQAPNAANIEDFTIQAKGEDGGFRLYRENVDVGAQDTGEGVGKFVALRIEI